MYKEEETFDVLNGSIPDFRSDVTLTFKVDGKDQDTIPEKGKYNVEVNCDKGASGFWNFSKWQIEVSDFTKGTKCNVTFTSTENPNIVYPNYTYQKVTKSISKSSNSLSFLYVNDHTKYRTVQFSFKEVPNYQNLTTDNFIAYTKILARTSAAETAVWVTASISSYDANAGIVTVNYIFNASSATIYGDWDGEVYCTCVYAE